MKKGAKTRLATASVLLSVLASGVLLGMALDRHLEARSLSTEQARRSRPPGGGDWGGRTVRDRPGDSSRTPSRGSSQRGSSLLVEQVGLSETQVEQVDSIMRYYREEMRALHEEFDQAYSSRYRELQTASREAVRAILTVEQLVVYDSIRAEWRQRWEGSRPDSAGGGERERSDGSGKPRFP